MLLLLLLMLRSTYMGRVEGGALRFGNLDGALRRIRHHVRRISSVANLPRIFAIAIYAIYAIYAVRALSWCS